MNTVCKQTVWGPVQARQSRLNLQSIRPADIKSHIAQIISVYLLIELSTLYQSNKVGNVIKE